MLFASLLRQCKGSKGHSGGTGVLLLWRLLGMSLHRCSAPVEAPGHELVVEQGQVWVLGSLGKDFSC